MFKPASKRAKIALLMMLMLNIGIAQAMNGTEDVMLAPTSVFEKKPLLAPASSTSEMRGEYFSPGNPLVRRWLIGSSAPECGHTCGACSPCEVEVVTFDCSNEVEVHAEACPVGYLCICHGKAFPIP